MTAKSRIPASATVPAVPVKPIAVSTRTAPLSLEEHVYRIQALAKRIDGYIQFMCQIVGHAGMSAEVKERAVITFYEKLLVAEQQLGRIHDELRLE